MKKLYIRPTIEVEQIEASSICAGSPQIKVENPTEDGPVVPPTKPEGTDDTGLFGAKGTNTWFLDFDED